MKHNKYVNNFLELYFKDLSKNFNKVDKFKKQKNAIMYINGSLSKLIQKRLDIIWKYGIISL